MALLKCSRIFSKSEVAKWRCDPKTLSSIKSVIIFFLHYCNVDFSTKIVQGFISGFCTKYAHQFQIYSSSLSSPLQITYFTYQRIGFIISLLISCASLAKNPKKRLKKSVFDWRIFIEYGRKFQSL